MQTAFLGFLLALQGVFPLPVGQKIITTSIAYGIDPVLAIKTLQCESGLKNDGVIGDHGLAYGIAQFHKATFEKFKSDAGAPGLSYTNMDDQIELFSWSIANKRGESWTCWKKIVGDLS